MLIEIYESDNLKDKGYQKCEWVPCTEYAKHLEPSGDGRLVNVCTPHRRLLRKEKKQNHGY